MRRKDIQDLEAFKAAVMEGIPPEERLRGLPLEERLRGVSPEELVATLSEEDRARLRELLEQDQDQAE